LDLSCWRVAFNGAEPVRAETLERFATVFAPPGFDRRAFYPCYGMAEGTLILSGGDHAALPINRSFDSRALGERRAIPAGAGARALVSSGRPAPDHRIQIVDPQTRAVCPDGTVGEIWVSGPSIAAGYWRQEELTKHAFLAASGGEAASFLRTGDLG